VWLAAPGVGGFLQRKQRKGAFMAYDLLIRNGLVIDGTGAPGRHVDVAISGGKIVQIGRVDDAAWQTIDASDCVVSPGFIDPHTHYDAQICWDGAVTPSSWHEVTSVVMGNCGVGIAPCRPESREVAMRDLVNVEAIPFDVLSRGITWDWETFPEYMDAAARRKPSLNLAFLAPLTPLRHYVMGEASMERAATAEETASIRALLAEAMDAGAFGFSSTILNQHLGFGGRPLACRNASRDELKAYANVLKEKHKGAIEVALTRQIGVLEEEQCETLDFLLDESGRPVTFIALFDRDDIPEAVRDTLKRAAPMIAKGARPQTSPLPLTSDPADMFGIRDRGCLQPGLAVDVAIFDPQTVGSSNRGERRYDLPGGGKRMVMPSHGVRYTIVNGITTYADSEVVGGSAGQVLRS